MNVQFLLLVPTDACIHFHAYAATKMKAALEEVETTDNLEGDYKTCHNRDVLGFLQQECNATYPECGGKFLSVKFIHSYMY